MTENALEILKGIYRAGVEENLPSREFLQEQYELLKKEVYAEDESGLIASRCSEEGEKCSPVS